MPYVRQTNFLGGELDPKLWGRTDLPVFGKGLRRCRNFFVSRHGAAVSRPGTTWVSMSPFGAVNAGKIRLVPFIYSDAQSYVLVFGNKFIQFISNGAPVLWTGAPFMAQGFGNSMQIGTGSPYALCSPFQYTDLADIQWAQVGDILTLVHPLYAPLELARNGNTDWTLNNISFDVPAPGFGASSISFSNTIGDTSHPLREWAWQITEVRRNARGVVSESKPVTVALQTNGLPVPARAPVYQDMTALITITLAGAPAPPAGSTFVAFRIYRGRGGLFGWIGDTPAGSFTDVGEEPNYAIAPPQGRNPFKVFNPDGSLLRTEIPTSVAFYEGRRFFGGTVQRPGFLFGSTTEDYYNFDDRLIVTEDMAVSFELACRRREEIRSLVAANRLIALTNASAWAVGGAGGPLAPDSIDARVQDEVGTRRLMPLVIDGSVLYSRAKGSGVRGLNFNWRRESYSVDDLSAVSQHLFIGVPNNIVDWTYQEDPWGIVWLTRADGTLLSFTPAAEGGAWARHDTDGSVESVCAVPESDEDAVYLVVRRTSATGAGGSLSQFRSIERMTSRVHRGRIDDDVALDCAIVQTFAGALPPAPAVINGFDLHEGKQIYVWLPGNGIGGVSLDGHALSANSQLLGPFLVAGGNITFTEMPNYNSQTIGGVAQVVFYGGLAFTAELESLDLASSDVRLRQKTVSMVGLEVDNSRGLFVGQDFDHLKEWVQRDVSAGYGPIADSTELVRVNVSGTWDAAARIALRQSLPLPLTVLGLTREVDVGGS